MKLKPLQRERFLTTDGTLIRASRILHRRDWNDAETGAKHQKF